MPIKNPEIGENILYIFFLPERQTSLRFTPGLKLVHFQEFRPMLSSYLLHTVQNLAVLCRVELEHFLAVFTSLVTWWVVQVTVATH